MADTTHTPAASIPAPRRQRFRWETLGDHIVLIIGAFVMMAPLLMLIQMSTIPDADIMRTGPSLEIGDPFWPNVGAGTFPAAGVAIKGDAYTWDERAMSCGVRCCGAELFLQLFHLCHALRILAAVAFTLGIVRVPMLVARGRAAEGRRLSSTTDHHDAILGRHALMQDGHIGGKFT